MTMIDLDPPNWKNWVERNKWWLALVLAAVLEEVKFHLLIDTILGIF